MKPYDVAIVGAGIIGLAHAYAFSSRGFRVGVFERSVQATGASVRNFGMIWTIGQRAGQMADTALVSNQIWRRILAESNLWHDPCGSLHLAYHKTELAVLAEYHAEHGAELLEPEQVLRIAPRVNPHGLVGGLYSDQEICVDPRAILADLPHWLTREHGVEFHFGSAVTQVEPGSLVSRDTQVDAGLIVVCSGDDYETLLPDHFRGSGLSRCKLQMMRAQVPGTDWRIGPMLCAGLTLLHYRNFADCPSLPALRERFQRERPDHLRHGIHVLVSQFGTGEVTIGDTHEYGDSPTPFTDERLDRLVLETLAEFLQSDGLEVVSRWTGVYSTFAHGPVFESEPLPGVHVITGVAGTGMTLSFGLSERSAERLIRVTTGQ